MTVDSGIEIKEIDMNYDDMGMRYTVFYIQTGTLFWADPNTGSTLTPDQRSTDVTFLYPAEKQ
ncbi:MAG: hypothetical protein HRU20_22990 [Pseudomonadales bacterium]|nr:hypothetical protein [Pseudomonadales bacterium]